MPERVNQHTFKSRQFHDRHRGLIFKILGWKCWSCGFNAVPDLLEVHHIDPANKHPLLRRSPSNGWNGRPVSRLSRKALLNELKTCALLCPTCHRAIERGIYTCPSEAIQ